MKASKCTEAQIAFVLKQAEDGTPVPLARTYNRAFPANAVEIPVIAK